MRKTTSNYICLKWLLLVESPLPYEAITQCMYTNLNFNEIRTASKTKDARIAVVCLISDCLVILYTKKYRSAQNSSILKERTAAVLLLASANWP